MADTNKKSSLKLKKLTSLVWVAIGLFIIASFAYFYNFHGVFSTAKSDWGTFGDFMGGTLNPLFAFLSLIAIIYTITIQTQELEYSREELKATKEELEKSRIAQEEQSDSFKMQNKSIKQQTFENTFFKLLEHHNSLLEDLNKKLKDDGLTRVFIRGDNLVASLIKQNEKIIKIYFMTLYQILKFVDKQNEDFFDAKLYTNIIRATLDDSVLLLLAINGIRHGLEEYKLLIEKYELLEHLNINSIPLTLVDDMPRDKEKEILEVLFLYKDEAFGKNSDLIELVQEKRAVK